MKLTRPVVITCAALWAVCLSAQELTRPDGPLPPEATMPDLAKSVITIDAGPKTATNATWPGLFQTGAIRPPDPAGTAGSNGILQVVNLRMNYYNKLGEPIWGPVNFSTFFSSVGNTGSGLSDPKALFDITAGRFYVMLQENTSSQSFLNVAVSKNGNPASSSTTDWWLYRFNVTRTVGTTNYGIDYPGFGYDSQAIYATHNMY